MNHFIVVGDLALSRIAAIIVQGGIRVIKGDYAMSVVV